MGKKWTNFLENLIKFDEKFGLLFPFLGVILYMWFSRNNDGSWVITLLYACQIYVFLLTLYFLHKPITDWVTTIIIKKGLIRNMGFFSLFVPGSGQIAFGQTNKGLLILFTAAIFEFIFIFYYRSIYLSIPAFIFWIWNVYDTDKSAKRLNR